MEKFPKLICDKKKLEFNIKKLLQESKKRNLDLVSVTKIFSSNEDILKMLINNGVNKIGDSRILNLKKFKNYKCEKMLLRIPMISELDDVVKYVDTCLMSEILTIELLSKKLLEFKRKMNIILMIETGDIREGILDKELILKSIKKITELPNIILEGIGTNFACYGATIPEVYKLNDLVLLKNEIEKDFNLNIKYISAGNSSHISIWDEKDLSKEINQIRCGASIFLGVGLNDKPIYFLKQNIFTLEAEIIELQIKPSASWGRKGLDAFGKEKTFIDIGNRKKAIVAIGRQDCHFENLYPIDKKITILGSSSDHLILDVTDSNENYKLGDKVVFNLDYSSILDLFTSPYVYKEIK